MTFRMKGVTAELAVLRMRTLVDWLGVPETVRDLRGVRRGSRAAEAQLGLAASRLGYADWGDIYDSALRWAKAPRTPS